VDRIFRRSGTAHPNRKKETKNFPTEKTTKQKEK
jgi:hypothetical protein